ncbi:uncharacterized protein LOC135843755 [Planococcus citri]|uniref:uncharacterized protein LOC135843755 n=1 Tax=Planococcus citri TaxID=170843 RepID=UPI0031F7B98E
MYLSQKLLITIIIPVISSLNQPQNDQGIKVEVPPESADFCEPPAPRNELRSDTRNLDEIFERESNKYWSVQEARKAIIDQDGDYDFELQQIVKNRSYEFKDGTYYTTGTTPKKYNWKENVQDFGTCCHLAAEDLRRRIEEQTKTPTADTTFMLLKQVESFILLVLNFIKQTIPFDTKTREYARMNKWRNKWKNWYQLSIVFPNVLAYYMMVPSGSRSLSSTDVIIPLILKIIKTPYQSLSYNRDGANAVAMFGPWLIATVYSSDCDEEVYKRTILDGSQEYKNVVKELTLPYSVKRFGKGLHRDGTYISHETVLGFGYLKMMCSKYTMYVYSFDKTLKDTPAPQCNRVLALILHQSVARGPPGILNRGNNFRTDTNPKATQGSKIMPLARVLRVNTANCRFFVRGVTAGIGFYEADHSSDLYSQYWVQSRIPFRGDSITDIPEFKHAYGLIFSTDHDNYTQLKSRTETTDIYYPTDDSWSIVGSLGTNEETQQEFLRQNYAILHYGKYRVYEYIRYAHRDANRVVVDLEIDNRQGDKELGIRYSSVEVDPNKMDDNYKNNLRVMKIEKGKIARLQHDVNLAKCTIKTILEEKNLPEAMWPNIDTKQTTLILHKYQDRNDVWTLNTVDNVISSSVSGIHSCAAPLPNEMENESIRDDKFVFDKNQNIYTYKKSSAKCHLLRWLSWLYKPKGCI